MPRQHSDTTSKPIRFSAHHQDIYHEPSGIARILEKISLSSGIAILEKKDLENFQFAQLKRIIEYSQKFAPFYREYMETNYISSSDIQSLSDIDKFPIIRKSDIQKSPEKFRSELFPLNSLFDSTTGGSTGKPLTVYSDFDHCARDKANTNFYMSVFGLDIFRFRSVRLYGDRLPDEILNSGKIGYLASDRKLILSAYNIRGETVRQYVEEISRFRPAYIHTRPSSILPLARLMLEQGLHIAAPVRFIFCDGEYITDGQRRVIESAFQARLVNVYGHTEGCFFGHPCEISDHLHFPQQVGLLELLRPDGKPTTEDGEQGEMVTTGFNNLAMPLIRYGTGDIAIRSNSPCQCGRHAFMIKAIEGRLQDYVVSRENGVVPLAPAIFNYNDMDWRGIREFIVVQDQPGRLTIKVVPEDSAAQHHFTTEMPLGKKIESILGHGFDISVEFVEDIPKSRIGKHRYLDQ